MRLIDADALKELRHDIIQGCIEFDGNEYDIIDKAPTIDAVEVVRCKDCKHSAVGFNRTSEGNIVSLFCCKGDTCKIVDAVDFCSSGERRDP